MKTIIKTIGFVCVAVLVMNAGIARAQQEPLYTQFMFNSLVFNPAYAGSHDALIASLHARAQWTGINDAPMTQTLLVHSPINNSNMGTGMSVVNDVAGPLTQRNILGYYSYGVNFSEKSKLTFGLNAGIYTLTADLPSLELADEENDVAFSDVYEDAAKFNVGFGMFYNMPHWYIGVSAPRLYNSDFLRDIDREDITLERHYYLIGGARFHLSDEVSLKPTTLIRKVNGAPIGFELSTLVEFNEKYWAGLAGRWEEGASIIVGGYITGNIRIGYSYDAVFSTINKVSAGSHEIYVSYEFPSRKTSVPLLR
jgi:type IX secretion system PorP/SprF family membrane protein